MAKKALRDVIVVIPGITGSVLRRDGKDLWAPSAGAVWGALTTWGGSLADLELPAGGGDDGIVATELMPTAHIVPGLVRIDGYSRLMAMIADTFEIARDDQGRALNLIPFPYDWRRDNRESARRLGELLTERLRTWRRQQPDAKVIVIAHSMGGLIARYWAECLDGWPDTRALITFGTPHRGSPNAVGYLANGYKKLFLDLTAAMRSFPAVHQLLPRYRALVVGDEARRVAETDGVPGVNPDLARDGLAFHREIEDGVTLHNREHGDERYSLLPFVGVRQPTIQSAVFTNGRVSVTNDLPPGIDPLLADGDGTVPRVSAIPIELSDEYRDTFNVERHGSLQVNDGILADVRERLIQLQVRGLGEVRSVADDSVAERPAIAIDLDEAFVAGEPVRIDAWLTASTMPLTPQAVISAVDAASGIPPRTIAFTPVDDRWRAQVGELEPGLYRVEVGVAGGGPWAPSPVHELFAVGSDEVSG